MRNMEVGYRRGSAEAVADLGLTACCRRKALLAYFGEKRDRCQAPEELCDFCRDPKAVVGSSHTVLCAYMGQYTANTETIAACFAWSSTANCQTDRSICTIG